MGGIIKYTSPTRNYGIGIGTNTRSEKARSLADEAGFFRFALPKLYGGKGHPSTNLWMSAIRFHLASHPVYGGGLGLANDLQNEHSVIGNFPDILMLHHFGNDEQRRTLIARRLRGEFRVTFGLTEPDHGSDATFMSTAAKRVVRSGYVQEYQNLSMWTAGCDDKKEWAIFAGPDGSAQVRPCRDLAELGLPACVIRPSKPRAG